MKSFAEEIDEFESQVVRRPKQSRVSVNLSINCGCGFRSDKIVDAMQHAEETCHQLTLSGVIAPK
jgi:hypothetical protein